MNQKFVIIVLCGVIVGMLLTVPTIFLGDIFVGGLLVGGLTALVAYFAMKRKGEV